MYTGFFKRFQLPILIVSIFVVGLIALGARPFFLMQDKGTPQKTQEKEAEYVPGEILVKFKTTNEIRQKLQNYEAARAQQESKVKKALKQSLPSDQEIVKIGIASINQLHEKHLVTKMDRVFPTARMPERDGTVLMKGKRRRVPDLTTIYKLKVPKDSDILKIIEEFERDPNVEYAEPNYVYHIDETIPNEYADRAALKNAQWALDKIQAPEAWDIEKGSSDVIIGIIDTGVDWDHPDLEANIWLNPGEDPWTDPNDPTTGNGIDDDGNGYIDDWKGWDFVSADTSWVRIGEDAGPPDNNPMDFAGHGTLCAGVAGAVTNNYFGVAGVMWECALLSIRAGYQSRYGGGLLLESDVASSIVYGASNDADVISMSFSSNGSYLTVNEAIDFAYATGVVMVASAGNENSSWEKYPAAYDHVINVAATDENDQKCDFSNFGNLVDVTAPGNNIFSTSFDNGYSTFGGTSAATPIVAGIAGLIKSYNPVLTNDEIVGIIISTTDTIVSEFPIGSGRVNAYNALISGIMPQAVISSPSNFEYIKGIVQIEGTASGNQFQEYTLYFGEGEYPDIWTEIQSSNTLIVEDILGYWDVSGLTGRHNIKLTVNNTSGQTIIEKTEVIINNDLWPFDLQFEDSHIGAGAVDDLDNDGLNEVIWQTMNSIYVFDNQGNIKPGWPVTVGNCPPDQGTGSDYIPAIGDLDNDGDKEVVIGFSTSINSYLYNALYAFHHDGTVLTGWPLTFRNSISTTPTLCDVDGDNYLEVFFVLPGDAKVYAYHWDGTPLSGWPQSVDMGDGQTALAVGDIDNDGSADIVVRPNGNKIYAWNKNGSSLSGWPQMMNGDGRGMYAVLADIDSDEEMEIISACGSGTDNNDAAIYVWNYDGSLQDGWPQSLNTRMGFVENIAVGEIDGDDDLELVSISTIHIDAGDSYILRNTGAVHVWNHDGTLLTGWPRLYSKASYLQGTGIWAYPTFAFPVIADFDNDNRSEIMVGLEHQIWLDRDNPSGELYWSGDVSYYVHILNDDGTELNSEYPKELFCTPFSRFLSDLDNNGDIEFLMPVNKRVGQRYYYKIQIWDYNGVYNPDRIDWGVRQKNNQRTGCYSSVPVTRPIASISYPQELDVLSSLFDIVGSAENVAFVDYKVEYGEGIDPNSWEILKYSTNSVHAGILADLDPEGLQGEYTIRLTVNPGLPNESSSFIHCFMNIYKPGWPKQFNLRPLAPYPADLNNDGNKEVIVQQGPYIKVYSHEGIELNSWPKNPLNRAFSELAIADISEDGYKDIIWADSKLEDGNSTIEVFDRNGAMLPGFPQSIPDGNEMFMPVIADVNTDGHFEIIVAGREYVYVWDKHGDLLSGWPKKIHNNRRSCASVGDLDKNGNIEIIINGEDSLYCYRYDGSYLTGWPQEITHWADHNYPVVIGDLNNDGYNEIVFGGYEEGKQVTIWKYDGTQIDAWGGCAITSLSLSDLNNDDDLEILVTSSPHPLRVTAYHHDGDVLDGWPKSMSSFYNTRVNGMHNGCVSGDINGDGNIEILLCTSNTAEDHLYVWNMDGSSMPGWEMPRKMEYGASIMPVITDLDNDGKMEIIVSLTKFIIGTNYEGAVYIYSLDSSFDPGKLEWPMERHDIQNTGWYGYENVKPQAITNLSYTESGNDVILKWSAVTKDIKGGQEQIKLYKIYRSTSKNFVPSNDNLFGTSIDTTFTDSNGNLSSYCYVVKALDKYCNFSDISNRVISGIKVVDYTFPQQSWYMISLPVIPQDSTVFTLFPTALNGTIYHWDSNSKSYDPVTKIEPQKGYWIAIPDATSDQVSGLPLSQYTMHFPTQGWYMIGAVRGSTDFTNPNDNPDGSVFSPAFGWNPEQNEYYQTNTLDEKNGYWVAVFGECDLTVGGGSGGKEIANSLAKTNWTTFTSQYGSMPPPPPNVNWEMGKLVQVPTEYGLSQNFPNPFNPETTIKYQLAKDGKAVIVVYNLMGKQVKELVNEEKEAGYYSAVWDGRDNLGRLSPSGVYILFLNAGTFTKAQKVMLVR